MTIIRNQGMSPRLKSGSEISWNMYGSLSHVSIWSVGKLLLLEAYG